MPHTDWRDHFRARTLELRAAFLAALTVIYERTAITVREIAAIADVSERDIYAHLRRLGCVPRRPLVRFPGRSLGSRRKLKPRPRLDQAGARRALARFRAAVARLREHKDAREERAVLRAAAAVKRVAARIARRERLALARDARHLAYGFDGLSVLGLTAAPRAPESTPEQDAAMRRELARRIEALIASRQVDAARVAASPAVVGASAVEPVPPMAGRSLAELAAELGIDEAKARRINEIGEEIYRRGEQRRPRIRSWD